MSMIITKKCLSRRTVLRGIGATIALPLLDGMVPAAAALRQTAANPVRRFGAIYVPNGMNIWQFTPEVEGAGFEFTPVLEPLTSFRDHLLVLTGLSNAVADAREGEGGGDHARAQSTWLAGTHAKKTNGPDIRVGTTVDQIVAREFGQETQLASLELSLEAEELVGTCEGGYSCAYTGTIAWRTPTTPLPMEPNPRAVFERLFGATDSTDSRARLASLRRTRSVLDAVTGDLAGLERKLGPGDRAKLTEYVEAVRDIERRIQLAEEQSDRELPVVEQPAGIPSTFEAHAKLMFDLMALAYQTDLTRVSTFLMGRESSVRTYPEIGVPDGHHPVSHHQGLPDQLEKLAKINIFHLQMFAYFLEKLRSTPDGDGSLLDHSTIVYGSGMSDSNIHYHHELPILLTGGGGADQWSSPAFRKRYAALEPALDPTGQDGHPVGRVRRQHGKA